MRREGVLRVFSPAKVNLGLSVLGLRPDGYHELDSIMAPLSVGDELLVSPALDVRLTVEGADLPVDEGNLVFRAARAYVDAYERVTGVRVGAELVLRKHLPVASGVGGGSSDAASTLLALARLYPAGIELKALALPLGADVPFFLLGGAAHARGVGEVLSPLALPEVHVVLANPGVAVSAGDAYRWLDESGGFSGPLDVSGIVAALAAGNEVPYPNALQGPVVARHAEIAEVLDTLASHGLRSPLMSGSGSTCFALAATEGVARGVASALQRERPDWWVRAARTVERLPMPGRH